MKKLFLAGFITLTLSGVFGADSYYFNFAKDLPAKKSPNFPFGGITREADCIRIPNKTRWGYIVNWGFAGTLDPGRKYKMTLVGSGDCSLLIRYSSGKQTEWILSLDGKLEREFEVPVYSKKSGYIRFSRPKKSKRELVLKEIRFDALPDPAGVYRLNRSKLRRMSPPLKQARGVSFEAGAKLNDIDKYIAAKANLFRLRFRNESELKSLIASLPELQKKGVKISLEYSGTSADTWNGFLPILKSAASKLYAVGLPKVSREAAQKLVAQTRKQLPNTWLVYQVDSKSLNERYCHINDYKILYALTVDNEKQLQNVTDFFAATAVHPLLEVNKATVMNMDDLGFNWSFSAKDDLNNFIRPLHRNGSKEYQYKTLVQAWNKIADPDSFRMSFATDSHYLTMPGKKINYGYSADHMREMAKLSRELKLDLISHGGDFISGREKNHAETIKDLKEMAAGVFSAGIRPAIAYGNHDNNVAFSNIKDVIKDSEWHDICVAENFKYGAKGDSKNPKANYYYYDFPKYKIRVITLAILENPMKLYHDGSLNFSINTWDISTPQLNWLSRDAFNFMDKKDREEWGVIIIVHYIPDRSFPNYSQWRGVLEAFLNGGTYSGESKHGLWPGKVKADFVRQGAGRILAILHGHFHRDMLAYPEGFAQIGFREDYGPEASIAVLQFDRKKNQVYILRYQRGTDFSVPMIKK